MKKIILLLWMLEGFVSFGQNDTIYYPTPYHIDEWFTYPGSRTLYYHLINGRDTTIEQFRNVDTWHELPKLPIIDTNIEIAIMGQPTPSNSGTWNGNNIIQIGLNDSDNVPMIYQDDNTDTIPELLLCSDTSFCDNCITVQLNGTTPIFYIKGYEVREFGNKERVVNSTYPYIHKEYLDEYKQPLNKNIVVWLTK